VIYVSTSKVIELTGLSAVVLREWTRRRALIPADIPAAGKGNAAKFSWRTVLIIRIANQLKEEFHLQLQAHAPQFSELREVLSEHSFRALYGTAIVCSPSEPWRLSRADEFGPTCAFLKLPLHDHLEAICGAFGKASPRTRSQQFDLFPATEIRTMRVDFERSGRDVGRRQA